MCASDSPGITSIIESTKTETVRNQRFSDMHTIIYQLRKAMSYSVNVCMGVVPSRQALDGSPGFTPRGIFIKLA
jgi:hypothetical protein